MIIVHAVSKSYGEIEALKQISFEIKVGQIFGLLGPNGAGKSTTINILNTLLEPDSGEVFIDGISLKNHKSACKLIIGVVPQEIALYDDLSAYENLLFWGGLYNIPKPELRTKADEVLDLVGLSARKKEPLKNYSGGMKRRINIASSLLHQPKVLLMDEPTVGVDPQSRSHIFDIIERLNQAGMTIIYTTHYMEEAERLCDSIAIIDEGNIVANGSLSELRKISQTNDVLHIKVSELSDEQVLQMRQTINLEANQDRKLLEIECPNIGHDLTQVIRDIQQTGTVIQSIDTQRANLESIFLNLTGKQLRD